MLIAGLPLSAFYHLMAALQNAVFSQLYINNQLVAPGNLNECRLRVVEDR
jgi:hypothetical protein